MDAQQLHDTVFSALDDITSGPVVLPYWYEAPVTDVALDLITNFTDLRGAPPDLVEDAVRSWRQCEEDRDASRS